MNKTTVRLKTTQGAALAFASSRCVPWRHQGGRFASARLTGHNIHQKYDNNTQHRSVLKT